MDKKYASEKGKSYNNTCKNTKILLTFLNIFANCIQEHINYMFIYNTLAMSC